jgi:transcriptional regulator with GAF, ATPase, and Fis domain
MSIKSPTFRVVFFWILTGGIVLLTSASFWQSLSLQWLFHLRGDRSLDERIHLITIGPDDIADLGGWPISRDFYGLTTHILHHHGVRAIGFDILFHRPDERHPEYDQALMDFMSKGKVALGMAFQNIQDSTGLPVGRQAFWPIPRLRDMVDAVGFSNVGSHLYALQAPLAIRYHDQIVYSLGVETARLALETDPMSLQATATTWKLVTRTGKEYRIPLDRHGRVWLNHFGRQEQITHTPLTQLLRQYRDDKDLSYLQDRIVLVAVIVPGIATTLTSPFDPALPASLIHATVIDNILNQNFIRVLPVWGRFILILILLACLASTIHWGPRRFALVSGLVLVAFIGSAILLFSQQNLALPLVLPVLIWILAFFSIWIVLWWERVRQHKEQSRTWQQELVKKQEQITKIRQELQELDSDRQQQKNSLAAATREKQSLVEEKEALLQQLQQQVDDLQPHPITDREFDLFPLIIRGHKSKLQESLKLLDTVKDQHLPVLLVGETGTGKEVLAQALVKAGPRREKPFITVNCGALSETLLESELFGHEKGAFTGAQNRKRGVFEQADGGTLFLDEVSETSEAFQVKLLRALQEGVIQRLGSETPIRVNVRIIAASNRDLEQEVSEGRFRQDLYYRLNAFPVRIPPLRERPQDIAPLADHFLQKHAHQQVTQFSHRAIKSLQSWSWPGNVRELENMVQRAAILAQSQGRDMIRESDLPDDICRSVPEKTEYRPLDEQILDSLRTKRFSHASITQTARELGNRDRGTIAEYLRGMCYEALVRHHGDELAAARDLAATPDPEPIERIRKKISEYREKLETMPRESLYKGLPRAYHSSLDTLLQTAGNSRS